MHYFTKENITFFIALFGFILSIWDFIELRFMRICRLNVECRNFITNPNLIVNEHMPMFLSLSISNKSSLPVTITSINLKINHKTFPFSWIPEIVHTSQLRNNQGIIDSTVIKSVTYPIFIPEFNSSCGFFYVPIDPKYTDEYILRASCCLEIHTNRGIKTCDITIPGLANDI